MSVWTLDAGYFDFATSHTSQRLSKCSRLILLLTWNETVNLSLLFISSLIGISSNFQKAIVYLFIYLFIYYTDLTRPRSESESGSERETARARASEIFSCERATIIFYQQAKYTKARLLARRSKRGLCYGNVSVCLFFRRSVTAGIVSKRLNLS